MKIISVTKGQHVVVDDADYEFLSQWKWAAAYSPYTQTFYAMRTYMPKGRRGKKLSIRMHRQIVGCVKGMDVDHINGNTLDNRRGNLRICTRGENSRNQKTRSSNSSGYKGVSWDINREKWSARIMRDGKTVNIGRFTSLDQAALAYNDAALAYHGPYAKLNKVAVPN
jgi:hypothetical protein